MKHVERDMNDDKFEAFVNELSNLQSDTIDKAMRLADKYKIDRATMLDGLAHGFVIFAELVSVDNYVYEEEGAENE